MDLFEFEEAVKNGEITDVEPYMRKQDFDLHRMILAENGIEVDRIVKRDGKQVIVNLIEKGLETERYDTWKNHPNKKVREALAEQGYYPDLYINDKSPDVRREVIRQYPKLSLKRMHNHNDRFAIRWNLVRESNPDLEVLGTYLETVTKSELKETFAVSDIEALKLKHQALMTHPSPIEKTMAPYQLFEINSPLWTLSYTAIEVFNITHTYDELEPEYKQMDDCIKVLFDVQGKLINGYPHNIRVKLRRQLRERNNMDLIEFEQAIINGEITDFRPYVDGGTFHENRDRKALCIKYGVAQELYPDWAQSDDPDKYDDWIQLLLAERGYCLDILSESDDETVLAEVLKHDINYAVDEGDVMMRYYRYLVYEVLMETKDIPLNVIEKYFETDNKYGYEDNKELELKYQAMQMTPTVIEKTMTPMQLFVAQNPLWALNLTGKQIKQVINRATGILELRKI